jgi:hypothetical protein
LSALRHALIYERTRSRHTINIPRTLFQSRTGRQPIYHIAIEEVQDWAYAGEPLIPLKAYPGVFASDPRRKAPCSRRASLLQPEAPLSTKHHALVGLGGIRGSI